jgi:hypothetical protein
MKRLTKNNSNFILRILMIANIITINSSNQMPEAISIEEVDSTVMESVAPISIAEKLKDQRREYQQLTNEENNLIPKVCELERRVEFLEILRRELKEEELRAKHFECKSNTTTSEEAELNTYLLEFYQKLEACRKEEKLVASTYAKTEEQYLDMLSKHNDTIEVCNTIRAKGNQELLALLKGVEKNNNKNKEKKLNIYNQIKILKGKQLELEKLIEIEEIKNTELIYLNNTIDISSIENKKEKILHNEKLINEKKQKLSEIISKNQQIIKIINNDINNSLT